MRRLILWLPLLVFVGFLATVAFRLHEPSDPVIRSRLIGQAVPKFALPAAVPDKPGLDSASLAQGEPRIVNIFASWCIPCIAEAPQLIEIARRGVPIDAIAIRDTPADIADFLARHGDPYRRIALDKNSAVQLALGSSGVPETFIVDGKGIIRHQHIGDIRPEHVAEILRIYEAAR
ncbi:DsbE family thiol:disulfide interchange protein [Sphingomonas sp.]|uniref:DsbE family thiol:disulfide interchange protein n=1 Tax=Sphingomonas sp. TaxID=28214 RepID=UPI002FC934A2